MSLRATKRTIIQSIISRGTLDGALQRNRIYKPHATTAAQRKAFRSYLAQELESLLQGILRNKEYTDRDHYRVIAAFANKISRHKTFRTCLVKGRLQIGTAQKLINLHWKMSWLLKPGIKAPLHCPFDSIIIRELGPAVQDIRWTKCDDIRDYKRLVAAARQKSGTRSLAEWELDTYRKRTIPDIL